MSYEIKNPLLPGFYPDPSIVRVGDDFYMVTSSFSFFPGVPIFHSRDLAHWEQIGHVLDRPSQLPLGADWISGGIFAPTLRFHDGVFYMITTNVDHGGNFIVTAEDPAGPWSEPHWIEGAVGIDPSLFWDDDGKAYYTGTGTGDMRHNHIWISEIDLQEFRLVGEKKDIWGGSQVLAWCPEAPHLYKKDGWYYLLIAEGGTEHFHAVTIARSKEVMGEYTGYDGNPIMTHRHLGMQAEIANTGHADIVQLQDGSWYMVMLASRPYGGYHKNMGRETFIAPMIWENGWPVVCPGTGKLDWTYPAPEEKQTAGLILLQNNYHCLRAELTRENGKRLLRVVKGYLTQDGEITFHDVKRPYQKEICGEMEWNSDTVLLELKAEGQKNTFCATDADGEVSVLASDLDGGFLGSETAGGFVGAYVGMFASGNGREGENFASFDFFSYEPAEE